MAHFNRDKGHERSIIQSIEIFQRGKGQKSNINQAWSGAKPAGILDKKQLG